MLHGYCYSERLRIASYHNRYAGTNLFLFYQRVSPRSHGKTPDPASVESLPDRASKSWTKLKGKFCYYKKSITQKML